MLVVAVRRLLLPGVALRVGKVQEIASCLNVLTPDIKSSSKGVYSCVRDQCNTEVRNGTPF